MLHYLASPYNHPDRSVMEGRRAAACRKAGELIASGVATVSPVAHNAAILHEVGGATGWEAWKIQDGAMLAACSKVLVLRLPGWEDSKGVAAEISLAQQLGKPIEYLDE